MKDDVDKKNTHKTYFSIAGLLIVCIFIFTYGVWYQVSLSKTGLLEVSFLDIGQGDAIYIKTPSGSELIIDGGPDQKLLSEVGKVTSFFDRTLDMIIVTNPDKDHYAGFIDLLDRFKVDLLVEPGTISSTPTYHAFKTKVQEKGIAQKIIKRGDLITLDKEKQIFLEVLFPDRDASGMSTNDGSLVMKLAYGETCIMLQGDSPSGVEEYIVNVLKDDVSCQILKTGHHGSRTSSSDAYVKAVTPEFAIVSLGKDNRYGHPHKEVLETLENRDIKILRTDLEGTITFVSNGVRWQRQ